VQKYMGCAPTSVLTRHYAQITDEMLREMILPAITKLWHKSGTYIRHKRKLAVVSSVESMPVFSPRVTFEDLQLFWVA